MDQNATRFARFRDTGDISALGRVFDDLAPRLLSLALHFCGNSADAEDVLQETFLVAMQRAESYDPSRPLLPWFAGLLHNVARNHRRGAVCRRAGELPRSSELPSAREIDPSGQAEREEIVALRVVIEAMGEARCHLMRRAEGVVRGRVVDAVGRPVDRSPAPRSGFRAARTCWAGTACRSPSTFACGVRPRATARGALRSPTVATRGVSPRRMRRSSTRAANGCAATDVRHSL